MFEYYLFRYFHVYWLPERRIEAMICQLNTVQSSGRPAVSAVALAPEPLVCRRRQNTSSRSPRAQIKYFRNVQEICKTPRLR